MGKKITVLGAGSWGTALASLLADKGHSVTLWCFEQEVVDDIVEHNINKKYLPGIEINDQIIATSSLKESFQDSEVIFEVIPTLFLREVLVQAKEYVKKDQIWVLLSKGIEHETLAFPEDIVTEILDFEPSISILSGPNFAQQIIKKELTGTVVAAKDKKTANKIKDICQTDYFKIVLSHDVCGVQVCGALKNVISLFLGILDGAEYVENTRAYFLTRGFDEMQLLVQHYNGKIETVYGLAGLGDVMLGLIGERNRNYTAGVMIGKGSDINDMSRMIDVLPEGINTVKSVQRIIEKNNLVLPICSGAYDILFEGKSVRDVVKGLF